MLEKYCPYVNGNCKLLDCVFFAVGNRRSQEVDLDKIDQIKELYKKNAPFSDHLKFMLNGHELYAICNFKDNPIDIYRKFYRDRMEMHKDAQKLFGELKHNG